MMIDISRDLDMLATSDILDESRALAEYPPIERNPMVPSMARIVITTISSMRVKPKIDLVFGGLEALVVFCMFIQRVEVRGYLNEKLVGKCSRYWVGGKGEWDMCINTTFIFEKKSDIAIVNL